MCWQTRAARTMVMTLVLGVTVEAAAEFARTLDPDVVGALITEADLTTDSPAFSTLAGRVSDLVRRRDRLVYAAPAVGRERRAVVDGLLVAGRVRHVHLVRPGDPRTELIRLFAAHRDSVRPDADRATDAAALANGSLAPLVLAELERVEGRARASANAPAATWHDPP